MTPQKVYSEKEHTHYSSTRNHRLVRAASVRGLTNIKVEWYSLKEYLKGDGFRHGWYLSCDQFETIHIGYEVGEAETRINKIEVVKIKEHGSATRK